MSLFPIELPPGIYRNGTQYQSRGRWYLANLVRFYQKTIQPIGGWRLKSTTAITGMGRAIISWHDNAGSATWTAIGTEQKLYAMSRSGALTDITPSGFTPGRANAIAQGGFGSGLFGVGTFGTPRADTSDIEEASMWSLDTFGQDLVGVMAEDGNIYEWALNTATPAQLVANSPTATSLVVTQEGMLMALGAEGVGRRAKWSDQRDDTDWTPSATNQAGDFDLQTSGQLMQGLRIKGGTLLYTDLDLWLCTYSADILVYNFNKAGDGCGAISRNCGITLDAQAVWMGRTGFWLYNGYVQSLPCDVWDYVFSNLNTQQASKVTCELNSAFGEVTWRYPSTNSIEIDSFVTWNFRENHWTTGNIVRLCGVDQGVTQYPLRVGVDGNVYEHEVGFSYDGTMPFLESGPIEIGTGDLVQYATRLIPDDLTLGDVTATFFVKFNMDGPEVSYGPYVLSQFTYLRFCAGTQVRVRFDGVANDSWRVGVPKLDLIQGGER